MTPFMPATPTSDMWNADDYDSRHPYVTEQGIALVDVLKPLPQERILDLGCGTGHLTSRIAQLSPATIGVDKSPAMIAAARKAYPRIRFEEADGAELAFEAPFDAVFSNAALHWMRPPQAVAGALARCMRKGGRLVAEFGGKGNVEAVTYGLYLAFEANGLEAPIHKNPWYFPSIAEYATLLEAHGLEVRTAALFDRPIALDAGVGLSDWLSTFAAPFFSGLSTKKRSDILAYTEFVLRDSLLIHGRWYVDYRRLRIVAVKV